MISPFERIKPGEPISASDFNRAMTEIERSGRWQVAAPMQLVSDANGNHISVREKPFIWVRITGHEASGGTSGGVDEASKYSGIEQTDDPSTDGAYDLLGGIEFYTDQLYLKEVNGRNDVPEGAIVKAYQSDNGSYFTFLFETALDAGFSGGANNCPFWNCGPMGDDINPPDDPLNPACTNQFWAFSPDVPVGSTDDYCGCTEIGGTNAGCWPYWNGIDLGSTGVSIQCFFGCFENQIILRKACFVLVPGGPFGLRIALVSTETGREFKRYDEAA